MDCVYFWKDVQRYRALFIQKQFNPFEASSTAKVTFLVRLGEHPSLLVFSSVILTVNQACRDEYTILGTVPERGRLERFTFSMLAIFLLFSFLSLLLLLFFFSLSLPESCALISTLTHASCSPQVLYSTYIDSAGSHHIEVGVALSNHILAMLNMPIEDLFDEAEDYALSCLEDVWCDIVAADDDMLKKASVKYSCSLTPSHLHQSVLHMP